MNSMNLFFFLLTSICYASPNLGHGIDPEDTPIFVELLSAEYGVNDYGPAIVEGVLQLNGPNGWKYVCGNVDPIVVCKELGYEYGIQGYAPTTEDNFYEIIECAGSETSLRHCLLRDRPQTLSETENCEPYSGVSITCSNSPDETDSLVCETAQSQEECPTYANCEWVEQPDYEYACVEAEPDRRKLARSRLLQIHD